MEPLNFLHLILLIYVLAINIALLHNYFRNYARQAINAQMLHKILEDKASETRHLRRLLEEQISEFNQFKTASYQRNKAEVENYNNLMTERNEILKHRDELNERLADETKKYNKLLQDWNETKSELSGERATNSELEINLDALQEQYAERVEKYELINTELVETKCELDAERIKYSEMKSFLKESQNSHDSLTATYKALQLSFVELQKDYEAIKFKLASPVPEQSPKQKPVPLPIENLGDIFREVMAQQQSFMERQNAVTHSLLSELRSEQKNNFKPEFAGSGVSGAAATEVLLDTYESSPVETGASSSESAEEMVARGAATQEPAQLPTDLHENSALYLQSQLPSKALRHQR